MMSNSPLSCDSNQSSETCIICLDGVNEDTIWFPILYSSCTCKYALHIECIKQHNIKSCVICKADIRYPVSMNDITIDILKNKSNSSLKDLVVTTEIVNVDEQELRQINQHTNENTRRNENILVFKKVGCYIMGLLVTCGFVVFLWYIIRLGEVQNSHSTTTTTPNRMLLLTNNV